MTIERRTKAGGVSIREREGGSRVLEGYAAVYYRPGDPATEYDAREIFGFVERIAPGAFDQALREENDVLGLFQHDADQLLGRTRSKTLRLAADDVGLSYEIDLGANAVATYVADLVARGDVYGSSFAFRATRETWEDLDDYSIRTVEEARIYDVSPVITPGYEAAEVSIRAKARRAGYSCGRRQGARDVALVRARLVEIDSEKGIDPGTSQPYSST